MRQNGLKRDGDGHIKYFDMMMGKLLAKQQLSIHLAQLVQKFHRLREID